MKRAAQGGFSLVSAVFVIVVLTLVLGFMTRMSLVQSDTVALASSGSGAYYAARGGLDWAMFQATEGGVACPASSGFAVGTYTVAVTCAATRHQDPEPRRLLRLTATATRGSYQRGDFVRRVVEATVSVPDP